jgi:hypothetical protein
MLRDSLERLQNRQEKETAESSTGLVSFATMTSAADLARQEMLLYVGLNMILNSIIVGRKR